MVVSRALHTVRRHRVAGEQPDPAVSRQPLGEPAAVGRYPFALDAVLDEVEPTAPDEAPVLGEPDEGVDGQLSRVMRPDHVPEQFHIVHLAVCPQGSVTVPLYRHREPLAPELAIPAVDVIDPSPKPVP